MRGCPVGFHAKSLMEKEAMKHFYTFLIFNVLFVSTTGGTVFETLVDFFSAPDMLIHSIAQVQPLTVICVKRPPSWCSYVRLTDNSTPCALCCAGLASAIALLHQLHHVCRHGQLHFRLPPLLPHGSPPLQTPTGHHAPGSTLPLLAGRRMRTGGVDASALSVGIAQAKEASEVEPFDYGWNMASDLLVFTYVIFYSVMSPLTLLFGSVYFISGTHHTCALCRVVSQTKAYVPCRADSSSLLQPIW